jgi:hypothetical protein
MVQRPMGNLNPELVGVVVTRSRGFFTAASGGPTITTVVSSPPGIDLHRDGEGFALALKICQ